MCARIPTFISFHLYSFHLTSLAFEDNCSQVVSRPYADNNDNGNDDEEEMQVNQKTILKRISQL